MAFDFPNSPVVGQQYTPVAGTIYTWNGQGWVLTGPASSSMVLLSSQTVSGAASVDFTGLLTNQFDEYEIHFFGANPSTNSDTLAVRVGQSGVYQTATSYHFEGFVVSDAAATAPFGSTAGAGISLTETSLVSNLATAPVSGRIQIFNPAGTVAPKRIQFTTSYLASNGADRTLFGGGYFGGNNNAIDSIRIYAGGGNITGTFKLYGIAGSALAPPNPGSVLLLSTQIASNSAALIFTGIDGTYDEYLLIGEGIRAATANTDFQMLMSQDGGSTWKSSYRWAATYNTDTPSQTGTGSSAAPVVQITMALSTLANTASNALTFSGRLVQPASTTIAKYFFWDMSYIGSGGGFLTARASACYNADTNAVNAIKFQMASGNITSGTIRLYGIRGS